MSESNGRPRDRILTTHVGSLVRSREIIEGMKAKTLRAPYDEEQLATDIARGVTGVVRKQVEIGLDIPNDGEYGKVGFEAYVHERLTGLEPRAPEPEERVSSHEGERAVFAEFFQQYDRFSRTMWMLPGVSMEEVADRPSNSELFRLTGPISYGGQAAVRNDIRRLKEALDGLTVADAFLTSVTPSSRKSDRNVLDFYPSQTAYLYAVADALHAEYRAITDAGFVVQLDYDALNPQAQLLIDEESPSEESMSRARDLAIEVLNHALRDIPQERSRYHHCWGSNNRPHTHDVPLRDIVQQMLKINAGAYCLEAANPRHEHEWMVWKDVKLPEGKTLIPGFISQSTNVVEHPELIAWRIKNYAGVIGKENIIAGADCGFSQHWDTIRCHPSVQWAKLAALVEGARLASADLWHE